jgi:V8-like Glu-specific endopeptidase
MNPLAPLAAASILAFAAMLAPSVAAPGASSGPERLAAIGRIGIGARAARGEGGCTAVLIASDQVLTATHCVIDRATGRPATPDRIVFAPAAAPGRPARVFVAATVTMPDRSGPIGGDDGLDVARIGLATAVDPALARPLALAAPDPVLAVSLAAYPASGQEPLALQHGCPLLSVSGPVLAIGCAVRTGNSGGAVLQDGPEGPALVAVIVARGGRLAAPLAYAVAPDR